MRVWIVRASLKRDFTYVSRVEALRSFIPLLFSFVISVCLPVVKAKSDSRM